jgi:hypothetical protein
MPKAKAADTTTRSVIYEGRSVQWLTCSVSKPSEIEPLSIAAAVKLSQPSIFPERPVAAVVVDLGNGSLFWADQ